MQTPSKALRAQSNIETVIEMTSIHRRIERLLAETQIENTQLREHLERAYLRHAFESRDRELESEETVSTFLRSVQAEQLPVVYEVILYFPDRELRFLAITDPRSAPSESTKFREQLFHALDLEDAEDYKLEVHPANDVPSSRFLWKNFTIEACELSMVIDDVTYYTNVYPALAVRLEPQMFARLPTVDWLGKDRDEGGYVNVDGERVTTWTA